jgi:glycosyltransferase involved in cell wall biosynthesis
VPNDPPSISVCIVCRNEADKLEDCLRSVDWAEEVVVMDLGSSDGSGELARARGARVIEHEPVPIVELVRNEVAAAATGDWILAMDPDERAAAGLRDELPRIARDEDIDAVAIPVMNSDFGYIASSAIHRFDPKIRFYRRNRVTWPTQPNKLPEIAADRLLTLPERDDLVLIHHRNRSIPEALERAIRYAPAEAQALIDSGETFTARKMFLRLARKAHKQYVQARAFDDGVPGIVRATVLVTFHFYVWASFWQLSGAKRTPADDRFLRNVGRMVDVVWGTARVARSPIRLTRRAKRAFGRDA